MQCAAKHMYVCLRLTSDIPWFIMAAPPVEGGRAREYGNAAPWRDALQRISLAPQLRFRRAGSQSTAPAVAGVGQAAWSLTVDTEA